VFALLLVLILLFNIAMDILGHAWHLIGLIFTCGAMYVYEGPLCVYVGPFMAAIYPISCCPHIETWINEWEMSHENGVKFVCM